MRLSRDEVLAERLEPAALIDRLPEPTSITVAAIVVIVLLGLAGVVVGVDAAQGEGSIADRLFSLVNEKTVPTFFSAALLAAGGLCSFIAARARLHGAHFVWIAFGTLLMLMSLDEVVQIHEKIEAWTGVDWEQPYLVVLVGAAVIWWKVLKLVDPLPRALLIVGAVGWAISFGLEDAEYNSLDHRVSGFEAMAVSEELLEMMGSTLFLLAIVIALKETRARRT